MPGIEAVVSDALDQASVCWSEAPAGVFDSARAAGISDALVSAIYKFVAQEARRAYAKGLETGTAIGL